MRTSKSRAEQIFEWIFLNFETEPVVELKIARERAHVRDQSSDAGRFSKESFAGPLPFVKL